MNPFSFEKKHVNYCYAHNKTLSRYILSLDFIGLFAVINLIGLFLGIIQGKFSTSFCVEFNKNSFLFNNLFHSYFHYFLTYGQVNLVSRLAETFSSIMFHTNPSLNEASFLIICFSLSVVLSSFSFLMLVFAKKGKRLALLFLFLEIFLDIVCLIANVIMGEAFINIALSLLFHLLRLFFISRASYYFYYLFKIEKDFGNPSSFKKNNIAKEAYSYD